MGDWKKRKLVKGARRSQASGKSKGLCPDPIVRTMCRRNRSYKHPLYGTIFGNNKEFPRKGQKK